MHLLMAEVDDLKLLIPTTQVSHVGLLKESVLDIKITFIDNKLVQVNDINHGYFIITLYHQPVFGLVIDNVVTFDHIVDIKPIPELLTLTSCKVAVKGICFYEDILYYFTTTEDLWNAYHTQP